MTPTRDRYTADILAWCLLIALPAIGLALTLLAAPQRISTDLLQLLPDDRSQPQLTDARSALRDVFSNALIVHIEGVPATSTAQTQIREALNSDAQPFISGDIWIHGEAPLSFDTDSAASTQPPFRQIIWPLLFPGWLEEMLPRIPDSDTTPLPIDAIARQTVDDLNAFLDDPMAPVAAEWLPNDPLLLLPKALQKLSASTAAEPGDAPPDHLTIWIPVAANPFSKAGQHNMLQWQDDIANTLAIEFPHSTITTQGMHRPAIESENRIRSEVLWLNCCSALLVLSLLSFALRSPRRVVALFIPVISGILWGVWLTCIAFGEVHILAIGIASVLFGVAIDYGLHLSTHAATHNLPDLNHSYRAIRKPLLIGAISTAAGFSFLLMAPIEPIRQVGVMVPVGVCAAMLSCRFLLPRIAGRPEPMPKTLDTLLQRPLPITLQKTLKASLPIAVIVSIVLLLPADFDDSLKQLQPPPGDETLAYTTMRNRVTAESDTQPLWLTRADSPQALFAHLEKARAAGANPTLSNLIATTPSTLSLEQIILRRIEFSNDLSTALEEQGFDSVAFAPAFDTIHNLNDVLSVDSRISALDALAHRLRGPNRALLLAANGNYSTVYPAPQESATPPPTGTIILDEQGYISTALATARSATIRWLLAAFAVLTLMFCITLGPRPAARLTLIPAGAVALPLAVISITAGITLLAVLGAVVGFCLALDYAAFATTHARQPVPSVRLSAITTSLVFGALSLSSIPALSQMGITVLVTVVIAAAASETLRVTRQQR